ncbi:hypothetical protein V8E51_017605 [Hyaloscypha variabilis]
MVFSFIICVLVTMRVPFQKQVLGPITLAMVLCVGFFAIIIIWIRDPFVTSSEIGVVFEKEWGGFLLFLYAYCTYPPTIALLIIGGMAFIRIYRK